MAHSSNTVSSVASASATAVSSVLGVSEVYERHADFVWASLSRLGVRESDLPDVTQDVFVVVHRRLATWDERSKITTWLFGICRKVAAGYRRRAWFRREEAVESVDVADLETPETEACARDARRRLEHVLSALPPERRAVFVMFEIEDKSCAEIAELFEVPIGTVHSRLHQARREFQKSLKRFLARERRGAR